MAVWSSGVPAHNANGVDAKPRKQEGLHNKTGLRFGLKALLGKILGPKEAGNCLAHFTGVLV